MLPPLIVPCIKRVFRRFRNRKTENRFVNNLHFVEFCKEIGGYRIREPPICFLVFIFLRGMLLIVEGWGWIWI